MKNAILKITLIYNNIKHLIYVITCFKYRHLLRNYFWLVTRMLTIFDSISFDRFSLEQTKGEFQQLKKTVTTLKQQVENVEDSVKEQFSDFLEVNLWCFFSPKFVPK